MLLEAIQGPEQQHDVLVIHGLRAGESYLVHPVVDGVVDPGVQLVDDVAQMRWDESRGPFGGLASRRGEEVVECADEDAYDVCAFVVDDGVLVSPSA